MKNIPILLRRSLAFLLFSTLIFCSDDAYASHFRYGNITWERVVGNPYQIRFKVSQAWRRSFFGGAPGVGSTVNGGTLNTGVSNQTIALLVTSVNTTEDWLYGEFTYVQTYPSTTATYTAQFGNCCRISPPALMNNADGNFAVSTIVTVGNGNDAPVSSVPPFVSMPVNTTAATYQIPANDPNGDALTFSLAPNGSFGAGTVQPAGVSISSSGLLTFNTTGLIVGRFYNVVVFVTDSKGARIQLDLMLRITNPSTPPTFDYAVTPGNSANFIIQPGQTLAFNVKAQDGDVGDVVLLNAVGVPPGASFTSGSGNPVTRSFSWTPTAGNVGTHQINFIAQDNASIQTNTIVNIVVSMKPQFAPPSPGNRSTFCYTPGSSISEVFYATDPDTADRVVLNAISGVASGMSFTPTVPTAAANPVQTTMSWTPASSEWGQHDLVMRATDNYSEMSFDTVTYLINNPPTFTTTQGNTTITAGQLFSYTFGTADANASEGDEVELESATLPSWLSVVDNNDGTWTISGIPALADSGDHFVNIEIEDQINHINGTHCGNAVQSFEVTVIPCDVQLSKSVTDVVCNGAATGAIDITAVNTTAPITYAWSNNAATEDVSGLTAGVYTFVLTDANGCTAFDTTTIAEPATAVSGSVAVSPVVAIPGHSPYTLYLGYGPQSVTLSATATGGTPGYSYSWSPTTGVSNPTSANTDVSPIITTTYIVTITDANGCQTTVSRTINVVDARCGNNNTKVKVCHYPPGNNGNPQSICISSNAVATHLTHGCKVGDCPPAKFSNEENSEIMMSADKIAIYPNPSTGIVAIELPDGVTADKVIVMDIAGKVINAKENATGKTIFDLNKVAKGIYFVQVSYSGEIFRTKISIQ